MTETALEVRVVQLEELLMHQQHLVEQLNEITIQLRVDLEAMSDKYAKQQKQLEWLNQNDSVVDDREEKPPHY